MNKNRLLRSKKQITKGRVVSVKTAKTVVVLVGREKTHPLYKKTFKRSKRYLVHDEMGASLGDLVEIVQIRPMSRNKRFQVQKIVGKNMEAIIIEELKEEAAEAIAEVMPEVKEELQPEVGQSVAEKESEKSKEPEVKEKKTKNKKGEK